jgi:hypothetical protein
MVRLMKCAKNCETNCFDVSNIHIFQGLGFSYRNLLTIKTEKERTPKLIWIITPTNPTMLQLLFSYSSITNPYYKLTLRNKVIKISQINVLLEVLRKI